MLNQKQKSFPRSPLSVIRNQISTNSRSISRSISRSPSFSPVSRLAKPQAKDYSLYVPVRSSSKIENTKPKSITSTHLELKSKRKLLVKESQKLEEKMNEIKKKIETEVKITRIGMKKPPRSHGLIFLNKIKKTFASGQKKRLNFVFKTIQQLYQEDLKRLAGLLKKSNLRTKRKFFQSFKSLTQVQKSNEKRQLEIAKRHSNLQILFNCFNKWQDFVVLEKMDSQDKSYIEEMDTLLDSFIHDSVISIN